MLLTPTSLTAIDPKGLVEWTAPGVLHARRRVLVSPKVGQILNGPWPARNGETADATDLRRKDLINILAVWQAGQPVLSGLQVKPLVPPPECGGVWEFRATNHRPQARLLGFFPFRNIFVATGVYPRDVLGERGSQAWGTAISVTRGGISKWLGNHEPVRWAGGKFRQHDISRICDDF